jgi:hypothetical protein
MTKIGVGRIVSQIQMYEQYTAAIGHGRVLGSIVWDFEFGYRNLFEFWFLVLGFPS